MDKTRYETLIDYSAPVVTNLRKIKAMVGDENWPKYSPIMRDKLLSITDQKYKSYTEIPKDNETPEATRIEYLDKFLAWLETEAMEAVKNPPPEPESGELQLSDPPVREVNVTLEPELEPVKEKAPAKPEPEEKKEPEPKPKAEPVKPNKGKPKEDSSTANGVASLALALDRHIDEVVTAKVQALLHGVKQDRPQQDEGLAVRLEQAEKELAELKEKFARLGKMFS